MKRGIFLLIIFSLNFAIASVEIIDYNLSDASTSLDKLSGKINVSIDGENYSSVIFDNYDQEMSLIDFLDANLAKYKCNPSDCLSGYDIDGTSFSSGMFDIGYNKDLDLGFYIIGGKITFNDKNKINFSLSSDFPEANIIPFSVDFCGENVFTFDEFSETFREPDYGCYDEDSGNFDEEIKIIGAATYCERIYIPKTSGVKVGAVLIVDPSKGTSALLDGEINMSVCTGSFCDECQYSPNNLEKNCTIDEDFNEGIYSVCITSASGDLDYFIGTDNSSGNVCGAPMGESYEDSFRDFAIYAQGLKYANYGSLNFVLDNKNMTTIANKYLEDKYYEDSGDCSEGCVLPLKFSGINQNIVISNIDLSYLNDGVGRTSSSMYNVKETPTTISYDGVLDLKFLNFYITQSGKYVLDFLGEELEKKFDIVIAPKIISVTPLSVPAGIPIKFFADVDFNGSSSLTYFWDFDTNVNRTTYEPVIEYTYNEIKDNLNLMLTVSAGTNLKTKQSFLVNVTAPEVAIVNYLEYKRSTVDAILGAIEQAPSWYRGTLITITGSNIASDELNVLEKQYEDKKDYIKIVKGLYDLDIPTQMGISAVGQPYIVNNLEDVEIDAVMEASEENVDGDNEDYAAAILNWQNNNVQSSLQNKIYTFSFLSKKNVAPLNAYSFKVKSFAYEDGYFVLEAPLSDLTFSKNYDAVDAGSYTVIPIEGGYDGVIEFYTRSIEPVDFFFSPALSSIVIKASVDVSCNHNLFCEEKLGENSDNCRSDCSPTKQIVVYAILIFLGFIFLYSVLQIWYNRSYEKYLFPDARELYNMLMFVANAKTRGLKEGQISASLKKQGWSGERISFILKKSKGKRTGLPELIPVSKISAKMRDSKAKREQAMEAKRLAQGANSGNGFPPGPNNLPPPINGSGAPYKGY